MVHAVEEERLSEKKFPKVSGHSFGFSRPCRLILDQMENPDRLNFLEIFRKLVENPGNF